MKINAIITGSTGMVGKGVLLECLEHPDVESVLLINRTSPGVTHPKIREIIRHDFADISSADELLKGYDACFFCLGVSSLGVTEDEYTNITYTLTRNFASALLALNPDMVFIYVSGTGTDSSEQGKVMWARVKGKTENAILTMGFKRAYAFRPGLILPEKGVKSKTGWYNAFYVLTRPLFPLLRSFRGVTTSARVGRAMINAVLRGYDKRHLENRDINSLAVG